MELSSFDLSGRPLSGSQADEVLFVDREAETREAIGGVEARTNVLLLGERGAGKTSLLHHVAARLSQEGRRVLFIESSVAKDAEEFLRLLMYRVAPRHSSKLDWRLDRLP